MSNGTMYKGLPNEDMDMLHTCNGADKVLKGYSDPKDSIQGRNLPDLPSSSSELQGIYCHGYPSFSVMPRTYMAWCVRIFALPLVHLESHGKTASMAY
ncbi:hypothetical protein DPMN_070255 [Dreissena polymorpha]|uniref:Uncharacterized protein n=1 Tax=Dreissena polymorpha TaxID=45954 RepID=A0A9D3Z0M6_DREPO|nr:hypothetical protein DPMN_070255 [Dreissena polymorpha]